MTLAGIWLGPEYEWQTRAACRKIPEPDQFFPNSRPAAKSKAICASCPVREQCLDYATEHDEPGIWAGTSQNERRLMRGSK